MACDSSIFRPIDSFIKYFGDIKPYHTKILEIVEQYIFREEINVEIEETPTFDITLENPTLCKGVGFGIDFDNECGFDALECCDLFECMGGFGLIFDNSDLLLTMPVVAITAGTPATNGTDDTGSASSITVSGNHLYDTYLNIQSIPDVQTMIVAGDQSALFSSHNMFWVVPRNSYTLISGFSTNIQIQGNHTAQLLAKINIEIQNSGANDGVYGVIGATYSPGSNLTTLTLNRELSQNVISGNLIVEASTKNNGVYQIDGFTIVGGNTHLQLTPDTPAKLTDSQVNNTHGVIQLRTGMVPNRKIWVEDDTVVANNGEWKIVQVSYDVPTNQTIIVIDGTLYDSTNPTTVLKLYGYETGAGFDGLNECSEPKAFNVNAAISEWLTITIEDTPIPGLTPTPTATVTPTITITPTISLSATPGASVTPTPTISSSAVPPTPTPPVTASASVTPAQLSATPTATVTSTPTPTPTPSSNADPFIDNRVSIVNLETDLYDGKCKVWSAFGNAAISSGWLVLDGNGDYLSTPNSVDFDFSGSDFCIEAFVEISSAPSGVDAVVAKWSAALPAWMLAVNSSPGIDFYFYDGNFRSITGSSIPIGEPVHLAAYRVGTTIYTAVNGVVGASYNIGVVGISSRNLPTMIGCESDGTSSMFTGKIHGVRITKGSTGGYGATNFTPPSFPLPLPAEPCFVTPTPTPTPTGTITPTPSVTVSATPVSGDPFFSQRISILNLDSDYTDAKGKVWTPSGDSNISGGWLNLDGTTDYVSTPNSSDFDFGSSEFCVEAFVHFDVYPSSEDVFVAKWGASDQSWFFGVNLTGEVVFYYKDSGGTLWFPTSTSPMVIPISPSHVAAYRYGNNLYVAINGAIQNLGTFPVGFSFWPTNQSTTIGAQSNGTTSAYTGKIRGVRITVGSSGGYTNMPFTPPSFPLPETA